MAEAWEFRSIENSKATNKNFEEHFKSIGKKFPKQCGVTLPVGYTPRLGDSTELDPNNSGHYQLFVGALL